MLRSNGAVHASRRKGPWCHAPLMESFQKANNITIYLQTTATHTERDEQMFVLRPSAGNWPSPSPPPSVRTRHQPSVLSHSRQKPCGFHNFHSSHGHLAIATANSNAGRLRWNSRNADTLGKRRKVKLERQMRALRWSPVSLF